MLTTEQMVVLLKLKGGEAVTGWALVHSLSDALPPDGKRAAGWIADSLQGLQQLGYVSVNSQTKSTDFRMLMYRITPEGTKYLATTVH